MKYHSLRSIIFFRLMRIMILAFALTFATSHQNVQSQTKPEKIIRISPAKLVEKVRKKIQTNPKISTTEVTAFANSMLEKYGYDYVFDVCEFISKPISGMNQKDGTYLFRSFLKRVDGTKQLIQFSSEISGACGECFAEFPVRKLSSSEIHLLLNGKVQKFTRPKEFTLDQMDLMDSTMKKVIRSWDVPTQDLPAAISEDGKILYLDPAFTNDNKYAGYSPLSKSGKKRQQEFPYFLLAISVDGLKFVEAKPILIKQRIEEISRQNDYVAFRRFRLGKKNLIVRYTSPCT